MKDIQMKATEFDDLDRIGYSLWFSGSFLFIYLERDPWK